MVLNDKNDMSVFVRNELAVQSTVLLRAFHFITPFMATPYCSKKFIKYLWCLGVSQKFYDLGYPLFFKGHPLLFKGYPLYLSTSDYLMRNSYTNKKILKKAIYPRRSQFILREMA